MDPTVPALVRHDELVEVSAGVDANRTSPEGVGGRVASPFAYFPRATPESKQRGGGASADALSPVPPDDEELGEIVDDRVTGETAPSTDDGEASQSIGDANEVRDLIAAAPTVAQEIVVKAACFIEFGGDDLAEVVHVELAEIVEDEGFLSACLDNGYPHRQSVSLLSCAPPNQVPTGATAGAVASGRRSAIAERISVTAV